MGAFGHSAFEYCELGLAPTPTGGEDGKRPMLRGYNRCILNPGNVVAVANKFPDANIALLTGPSSLNVVDIDEPSLLHAMRKRFGETPLIVKTAGRGGYQMYYRASIHVRAADLRLTEGIAVEIKAGGNIVIAPPSRSPITDREYEFVEGCFDHETLASLPTINIPAIYRTTTAADHRTICEGHRNNWLFSLCLREARHVDSLDALLDVARTRNDEAEPPLSDAEVTRVCKSAWAMTTSGRNFASAGGHVVLDRSRVERLCDATPGNPVSLMLRLEIEHAARVKRGETFALATRAMVEAGTLKGWSRQNLRTAIAQALDLNFLECVERQRGFARYTLPKLSSADVNRPGLVSNPNVTKHSSPCTHTAELNTAHPSGQRQRLSSDTQDPEKQKGNLSENFRPRTRISGPKP